MSNETKRDVLERLIECYSEVSDAYTNETGSQYYCDDEPNYLDEYDAALPDDLPVIPKRVSKIIRITKSVKMNISQALIYIRSEFNSYTDWSLSDNNSETFALAWVLGVWKVKETDEVVKL